MEGDGIVWEKPVPAADALAAAEEAAAKRWQSSYGQAPEPVTAEEGFEMLDAVARRRLGISAVEFLRRWDAGEYGGPESDVQEVVKTAMLIHLAR